MSARVCVCFCVGGVSVAFKQRWRGDYRIINVNCCSVKMFAKVYKHSQLTRTESVFETIFTGIWFHSWSVYLVAALVPLFGSHIYAKLLNVRWKYFVVSHSSVIKLPFLCLLK